MKNEILKIVMEVTGVTREQIIKPNRKRVYSDARKIAMALCRDYTPLSYPKLEKFFKRHHTTIMTACEYAKDLRITNEEFASKYLMAEWDVQALLGLTKIERLPSPLKKAA